MSNNFDLIPNEILHQISEYSLINGTALNNIDRRFRGANEIQAQRVALGVLKRASTEDTILDKHVRSLGAVKIGTFQELRAFFKSIIQRATELGVECPMKVVLPQDIVAWSQKAEDTALEKLWNLVFANLVEPLRNANQANPANPVEISRSFSADQIRAFLNTPVAQNIFSSFNALLLPGQQLVLIPSEIKLFSSIRELNLSRNKLSFLPPEVGNLSQLEALFVDDNQLTALPPEIGKLMNLAHVKAINNRLSDLPQEMGQLAATLQTLELNENRFKFIPSIVFDLTGLTGLNVSHNEIAIVSAKIDQLVNLSTLDLSHNKIVSVGVPPTIRQLAQIQHLFLHNNRIKTLPAFQSGDFPQIHHLTIDYNDMTVFPEQIVPLPLQVLTLSGKFPSYPQALGQMHLQCLALRHAGLQALPKEILLLKDTLRDLNLSHNEMEEIPKEISSFRHLISLSITNNRIKKLPEVSLLRNLSHIELSGNQIDFIPQEYGALARGLLESLDLRGNPIKEYPEFLTWLRRPEIESLPLSFLYRISSPGFLQNDEEVLKTFAGTPLPFQHVVYHWVWRESGCPTDTADPKWGENHARDDMLIFKRAFFSAILESLNTRTVCGEIYASLFKENEEFFKAFDEAPIDFKNQVYQLYWWLSGKPDDGDLQWGEHHAKDNPAAFKIAFGLMCKEDAFHDILMPLVKRYIDKGPGKALENLDTLRKAILKREFDKYCSSISDEKRKAIKQTLEAGKGTEGYFATFRRALAEYCNFLFEGDNIHPLHFLLNDPYRDIHKYYSVLSGKPADQTPENRDLFISLKAADLCKRQCVKI